ncbi:MAG: flagellin FliC, partial [Gammaproteobacteria bacterium]|nr:flagellin FliC [Gammaproteobacteria bacterium]
MVASVSANSELFTAPLQNRLGKTNTQMQEVMQRLSSGQRINQAKDDAAGLAIAERMLSQLRGMDMAERNVMDASSVMNVADAYAGNLNDSLMRMQELAVQSANGLYSDSDRALMQKEFSQLQTEVSDTLGRAEFNGRP